MRGELGESTGPNVGKASAEEHAALDGLPPPSTAEQVRPFRNRRSPCQATDRIGDTLESKGGSASTAGVGMKSPARRGWSGWERSTAGRDAADRRPYPGVYPWREYAIEGHFTLVAGRVERKPYIWPWATFFGYLLASFLAGRTCGQRMAGTLSSIEGDTLRVGLEGPDTEKDSIRAMFGALGKRPGRTERFLHASAADGGPSAREKTRRTLPRSR